MWLGTCDPGDCEAAAVPGGDDFGLPGRAIGQSRRSLREAKGWPFYA